MDRKVVANLTQILARILGESEIAIDLDQRRFEHGEPPVRKCRSIHQFTQILRLLRLPAERQEKSLEVKFHRPVKRPNRGGTDTFPLYRQDVQGTKALGRLAKPCCRIL